MASIHLWLQNAVVRLVPTSSCVVTLASERIQRDSAVLRASASERTHLQQVLNYYHPDTQPGDSFSDMVANYSSGTSDYNAFTVNASRRFSGHWEMLASYTGTASTTLPTCSHPEPQDNYIPISTAPTRSSTCAALRLQRVLSNKVGSGFTGALLSNWTVAPIIEAASDVLQHRHRLRPELDFSSARIVDDRARDKPIPAVMSRRPRSIRQLAISSQPASRDAWSRTVPVLIGNLARNAGTKPTTVFNDLRIARSFRIG